MNEAARLWVKDGTVRQEFIGHVLVVVTVLWVLAGRIRSGIVKVFLVERANSIRALLGIVVWHAWRKRSNAHD